MVVVKESASSIGKIISPRSGGLSCNAAGPAGELDACRCQGSCATWDSRIGGCRGDVEN